MKSCRKRSSHFEAFVALRYKTGLFQMVEDFSAFPAHYQLSLATKMPLPEFFAAKRCLSASATNASNFPL